MIPGSSVFQRVYQPLYQLSYSDLRLLLIYGIKINL